MNAAPLSTGSAKRSPSFCKKALVRFSTTDEPVNVAGMAYMLVNPTLEQLLEEFRVVTKLAGERISVTSMKPALGVYIGRTDIVGQWRQYSEMAPNELFENVYKDTVAPDVWDAFQVMQAIGCSTTV